MRLRLAARAAPLIVACAVASPAGAQLEDDGRKSARLLGEEAAALFAAGDFAGAMKKYEVAYALVPVPTLGVRLARSLDKLGRLLDAEARYKAVIKMELDKSAPAVHAEAKEQAKTELEALQRRIPRLVVEPEVEDSAPDVTVTVDGVELKPAEWRQKRPVNPGAHRVVVARAGREVSRDVKLEEGEVLRVAVSPPPPPAPAPSASAPPPPPPAVSSARPPEPPPVVDGGSRKTLGYVALGVGGVGLAVGVFATLAAMSKKSSLDDKCASGACPPSAFDDLDAYESRKRVATGGLVLGVAGAAVGGVLLWTDLGAGRRAGGFVGPGRVGLGGTF